MLLTLPHLGDDWLPGLKDYYIILSLKHSSKEASMFWLPNDCGYTYCFLAAGKYRKQDVVRNLHYYNDGIGTVAIPCTEHALAVLGLYTIAVDYSMLHIFLSKEIAETPG